MSTDGPNAQDPGDDRTTRARLPTARPRWGLLAALATGCLYLAVPAGFLGLLHGGDFASGGRSPVGSALFWTASGVVAALPVVLLPRLGFPVRRPTAVTAAVVLAAASAIAGWSFSAR